VSDGGGTLALIGTVGTALAYGLAWRMLRTEDRCALSGHVWSDWGTTGDGYSRTCLRCGRMETRKS